MSTGTLSAIGKTILRRLKALGGHDGGAVDVYLPRTEDEKRRWMAGLGVKEDRLRGRLIAVASDAAHAQNVFRRGQAKTPESPRRRRPRNHPRTLGLRAHKRKLRKRGSW